MFFNVVVASPVEPDEVAVSLSEVIFCASYCEVNLKAKYTPSFVPTLTIWLTDGPPVASDKVSVPAATIVCL